VATFANLLRRVGIQRGHPNDRLATGGSDVRDVDFRIPNMVCDGCAEKIDGVLLALPGVREVRPNVPQKCIRVRFEPTMVDLQQLKDAVTTAGFTAVEAEAPLAADPGKSP
jgi:Cu+-exporting ATPase